jgi:putative SOS response-associated peptidase YedK
MCYDMSFFCNIRLVSDFLPAIKGQTIQFEPTYHRVAQAFGEWPVVINEDGLKLRLFEWGLIADYMNTPEKVKEYRMAMANARSEKILHDKRSVWHRLRRQRCLVFTTGFFEHHDAGLKKKVPFFIKQKGQEIFCLAGLYNYSPIPDPHTGEVPGTFAVVTRAANPLMAKIHNSGPNSHRMPLILTKELAEKWIDDTLTDTQIGAILDYEYPESGLDYWPVNTIRTRKEDDERVVERVEFEL